MLPACWHTPWWIEGVHYRRYSVIFAHFGPTFAYFEGKYTTRKCWGRIYLTGAFIQHCMIINVEICIHCTRCLLYPSTREKLGVYSILRVWTKLRSCVLRLVFTWISVKYLWFYSSVKLGQPANAFLGWSGRSVSGACLMLHSQVVI